MNFLYLRRCALVALWLLSGALLAGRPTCMAAQHHDHGAHTRPEPAHTLGWGAQVVPLLTHAAPAIEGRSLTEAYLTQPNVMAHGSLWSGRLQLMGVLNLEGVTLQRGELTPGIWGEGYVDRRHPHTYLHEVMAVARLLGAPESPVELTLSAGKGFAPFGTDDPMVRPFVKYPVNHHLSQILERLVGIVALRVGPVIAEAGLLSGDEPTSPAHFGSPDRFGDSWAVRGTLLPLPGLEASASYAMLSSPEHMAGSGIDQRKRSASVRFEPALGSAMRPYMMLEWAHTQNYVVDEPYHAFGSWLAEAALRRGGAEVGLRYERTTRPEEERSSDPFRTQVPHHDIHLMGATRWDIVTAVASHELRAPGGFRARPFTEVAYAKVTETLGSLVFDPREWYGATGLWNVSLGVRLEAGMIHRRMGRYGAAVAAPAHPAAHH